jgi:putative membrane protein
MRDTETVMDIKEEERCSKRMQNRRVHMANERTFLAWIRTSIGIMAFGFVVERFAIFTKQFSHFLFQNTADKIPVGPVHSGQGHSSMLGIILVGLGALMGVLAFIRYKTVEKQIDEDTYKASLLLDILLTISISVIGIFLIIYIIHSL